MHGPHLYMSFCGPGGTTTEDYVPQVLADGTREAVAAWQELSQLLPELARRKGPVRSHGSSSARATEHFEMVLPEGDKLWDATFVGGARGFRPRN